MARWYIADKNKPRFPWGSVVVGALALGATGAVIYAVSKSSQAIDRARSIYRSLSPRDRFVGMLYLDASLRDIDPPTARRAQDGSQLAILAMNLLSDSSPRDRAEFFIEFLGGPAGVTPEEKAFTAEEVRLMRAALDFAAIPYASPDADRLIKSTNEALAARLGL